LENLDIADHHHNWISSTHKNYNHWFIIMKKKNILDIIVDIIIILTFILAIYWFFQLLFGGSPSLSEFNSLLIVMVAGILFNLYREMGEIMTGFLRQVIGKTNK